VRLFCDGVARRVCHGGVGFNITILSLRAVIVAIVLKCMIIAVMKFVCRLQLAEFVIFLLVMSSLFCDLCCDFQNFFGGSFVS
jgi:hypothetical protein